jgi:hypothetical protein
MLIIILSFILFFSGLAYFLYLQFLFPKLVPHHGGGERFILSEGNDFTFQIPWTAYTRLHLSLQANDSITLYINSEHICECAHYDLIIEPGKYALVMLRSESPVSGMFTARQEIPSERQFLAFVLFISGLVGVVTSLKYSSKPKQNRLEKGNLIKSLFILQVQAIAKRHFIPINRNSQF